MPCIICDTLGAGPSGMQHTYGPDCLLGPASKRKQAAQLLKNHAMEVAAALETIAYEDDEVKIKAAQKSLRDHIDGHYHAIVIGNATTVGNVME